MEVPWKCPGSAIEVPLKCCWSANSQKPTATATYLPLLTPPLSTVGWSKTACFNNIVKKPDPLFLKILSSPANIRNTFFDQRSPRHPEVFQDVTNTQNRPSGPNHWKCWKKVTNFFFRVFMRKHTSSIWVFTVAPTLVGPWSCGHPFRTSMSKRFI